MQLDGHPVLSPPSLRCGLGVPPRHAMTAVYPGLVGCTHVSVSGLGCSGGACGLFDGYVLGSNGASRPGGGGAKS